MLNETPNKNIAKTASEPKGFPWGYLLATLAIVASLIVGGWYLIYAVNRVAYVQANLNGQGYRLEVASTESARERGLSQRDSLDENQGMLFVFPSDGDWSIWMLQMRYPIDIVWLDANKRIVGIKENATPGSYPEAFRADAANRYVIELNAGSVQLLGLKIGQQVSWQ